MKEARIISYCKIRNGRIEVNGETIPSTVSMDDLDVFLSQSYKQLALAYPKYFKMDKQCKLGILAAEYVLKHAEAPGEMDKQHMALVFSNSAGSIDSDRKHLSSISDQRNYFPSPAVFVYTLANIVTGEIAIRHNIRGENAFFITENFNAGLTVNYCRTLLENESTQALLAGWINVDGNSAEAFVYCVKYFNFSDAKNAPGLEHSEHNIQQLYGN